MTNTLIAAVCNYTSAASALAAAVLWYRSATVRIPHEDKPGPDGWHPAAIVVDESDFIKTAMSQALWSKRAAYAAALAALFQGVALLVASCTA